MAKKSKKNVTNKSKKIRSSSKQKRKQRRKLPARKNKTRKKSSLKRTKNSKVSKKNIRVKLSKPKRKSVKGFNVSKKVTRARSKKTASKKVNRKRKAVNKSAPQGGTRNLTARKITALDFRGDISYFLQIDLSKFKKFQDKINAIRNWSGNGVEYFLNRTKMFPRAFMIILTTYKKGKTGGNKNEKFERANVISPPGMAVNIDNIKKLILEYMIAFQDNYLEYIDGEEENSDWVYDPAKIIAVSIRFFYG